MNADNENIEPLVTDLGLALGYSSQCIQRRLNSDSGAGANAGSRLNMTFVANNPLSELVWSPHKGPSNVALLPAQVITGRKSATVKHTTGRGDFQMSNSFSLQSASEVAGAMPVETGGDMEEINSALGAAVMHTDQKEELGESKGVGVSGFVESQIAKTTEMRGDCLSTLPGQVNRKKTDILSINYDHQKPEEVEIEPSSADPIGGDRNINNSKNYSLHMNYTLTSEAHCVNVSERVPGDPMGNQTFQGRRKSFEKIESTSENICSAANDTVGLEFSLEVKGGSQQAAEDVPPSSKTISSKHSPTSSRVHTKRRKGKEKALSDGMMPKDDDDDSNESVESCNSAGLLPKGKRRRSSEEDLGVGTKRFRKQIHFADGSTSFARQDSSFMSWISNMMKGFSQSVQDKAPLPLSVARPDDVCENLEKKHIAIDKNQDPRSKIIGFQSIFQSLYCGKAEVQERRMLNVEYQVGEGSKELESSNKISNNNAAPIACQGENSNSARKQFLLLNERLNESTSGNGEALAIQPKILLDKSADSQEKGKTSSEENKNKFQLALSSKEKERTSSNSSLGKQKSKSAELADSDPPSAVKMTSQFRHRNDSLGSIWITRLAAKFPGSSANPDHLNPSSSLSPKHSVEYINLIPHVQNHIGSHVNSAVFEGRDHSTEDPLIGYGKELQNCSTRIKIHDDPKSMYKLTPVLPFPQLNHSDAMASVFARRLDALKHVTSSRATVTCFFCGIKGHNLRDCSEITQTELDELVKNLNTCSGIEELSCLCIRCFQPSHWAVACPKRLHVESIAFFSEMQLNTKFQGDFSRKYCEVGKEEIRTETDFNSKADEMMNHRANLSSISQVKNHENRILPFQYFVSEQNSDVPKGLFDAVKRLRLSRSDITNWKNSRMSLSQLNGFFLRLRLGKWEEGLGGTGYHVACIIGTQGDDKTQDVKRSILVKVGGIKCSVESHYVSNHDFLEDELMAWWSITSRNGEKIPSKEDLELKVKTKQMLGF